MAVDRPISPVAAALAVELMADINRRHRMRVDQCRQQLVRSMRAFAAELDRKDSFHTARLNQRRRAAKKALARLRKAIGGGKTP